jgi:hypothetical protein
MPTREEAQVNDAVKSVTDLMATLKKNGQLKEVVKKLDKEEDILFGEKPKKKVNADAEKKAAATAIAKKKAAATAIAKKKAAATAIAKKKAAEKTTDAKERVKDINNTTINQMKNYLDISGVKYTKCTLKKDWIDAIRVDGSRKYLEHINSL